MGNNIKVLCSLRPADKDSLLFHTPNIDIIKVYESLYEIPVIVIQGSGDEEVDLFELMKECKGFGIRGIVTGALASDFQRMKFLKLADELDLKLISPLWKKNQEYYLRWLISDGFLYIITKISTFGLPIKYLGVPITRKETEEIIALAKKYGFNPAFEGGEAETLVLDAPLMKRRMEVEGKIVKESEYVAYYEINNIKTYDKRENDMDKLKNPYVVYEP